MAIAITSVHVCSLASQGPLLIVPPKLFFFSWLALLVVLTLCFHADGRQVIDNLQLFSFEVQIQSSLPYHSCLLAL